MAGMRIGVVGATGVVGLQLVKMLEEVALPVSEVRLFATAGSAGRRIPFAGESLTVEEVSANSLSEVDLAFFAVGTDASRQLAPAAVKAGTVAIDKSNAFRMDPQVPLVVPGVNPHAAREHNGIIASPNCSTIQMVLALKPLDDLATITRVTVTSFQSVSGSGRAAMEELERGSRQFLDGDHDLPRVYPHPIAFNLLPHIDDFDSSGYTGEEQKLRRETRKIMGKPHLNISATCVRVPVFVGHSESVLIETEQPLSPQRAREALEQAVRVRVVDRPEINRYPMPRDVDGLDQVLVGRIREDLSSPQGLWLWVVADNLRIGAATNALDIAQLLWEEDLI